MEDKLFFKPSSNPSASSGGKSSNYSFPFEKLYILNDAWLSIYFSEEVTSFYNYLTHFIMTLRISVDVIVNYSSSF
jgi:hypothetical protein